MQNNPENTLPETDPTPNSGPGAGETRALGWVLLAAFTLALVADLIVFKQKAGLQWALLVNALLLVTLVLTRAEHKRLPAASVGLALFIGVAALLTVFRAEAYTLMALVAFALLGLVLLAASLLNGRWAFYRFRDYLAGGVRVMTGSLTGMPAVLIHVLTRFEKSAAGMEGPESARVNGPKPGAVLRGVLITIPLVLLFAGLLASADTIFSDQLGRIFKWIHITNLQDVIAQLVFILLLFWAVFGALRYALARSEEDPLKNGDAPLLKPFLGMTESVIVLVSLNLLFAAFLLIQFRYFFAGEANISIAGFTYSEYARRGFFELLAVAFISWGLHYVLASVTRRENRGRRMVFSILASLLLAQVGVMLVSAFQRLALYESAYGFTQDRLLAHVFMIFLGVILALSVGMEILKSFRHMALVLLVSLLIFGVCLAVLNVDATIASRNLDRAAAGKELDARYLATGLTEDATPILFERFNDPNTPNPLRDTLGKILTCRAVRFEERFPEPLPWFSWHAPRAKAAGLYTQHALALEFYPLEQLENGYGEGFQFDEEQVICRYPVVEP